MCREMAEQREAQRGQKPVAARRVARSKTRRPIQVGGPGTALCVLDGWMDGWMDRRLTVVVYCIIVGIVEC